MTHNVSLDVDTRLRLDATMKTGSITTEVDVTANGLAVDTQGATIGQVIDNELVENLPVDGNNVVALAALLPGVTDVNAPTTFTDENGGSSFSANGSRVNSNLFLFDGLLWNNLFLNTGLNYPNHAALQEVSVQISNFSAQYGRSAGSIFNVVSKSGTNTLHGEVFLHVHDSATDATNFFLHKVPPQQTFQFGGAIGGPIRRDKLFFLAEYQSLIGYSSVLGSAPTLSPQEEGFNANGTPFLCTAPALAGKQCASFAGDARTASQIPTLLVNPLFTSPSPATFGTNAAVAKSQLQSTWIALGNSGTNPCITTLTGLGAGYLPNAEVPSECFDPTAQAIIRKGYIPTPTTAQASSQFLYSEAATRQPQQEYGGIIRVDQNLNPKQNLSYRFYRTNNSDLTSDGATNNTYAVPTYEPDANAAHVTAGSVSHTYILTSNMVNSATFGYKRYNYEVVPTDPTTLNTLGSTFTYPGYQSLPVINVSTRFTLGNGLDSSTRSVNENFEALDNVSIVHGRNNFQLGEDYLHEQYLNIRTNVGSFSFLGNPGFTNAQAADFILGLVYTVNVGNPQRISAIQNAFYQYAQDTFRATSRLTLNLGVRYELPMPWYQPDGNAATFIRGYQSQVFPNAPAGLAFVGDSGVPRSLINADYTNFSPRIGLAYDVFGDGHTAIRAGLGTFYDAIPATIVGLTQPYTFRAFTTLPAGSLTNPLYGQNPIPAFTGKGDSVFTSPYSVIFPDKNFRNAYTIATNFGIQQQLSKGSVLELNYIGRFARHQVIPVDMNPAIVDCSGPYYQANPALYCTNLGINNAPCTVGVTCTTSTPTGNVTNNYAGRVRYPGYNYGGGGVVDLLSEGTANYNAVQINFRQRSFKNLTMLANYTYARTLDEQSTLSTSSSTPQPDNLRSQYGPSDQNTTQIFNMGWRLGLAKLRTSQTIVRNVFGDWSFSGIYNARTGHPFNVTFGGDELGTDEPSQRAYLAPGQSATLSSGRHRADKIKQWFNAPAFSKPAPFTAGNIGRNSIIGPAYINTEFSLTKNIQLRNLREGAHGQFRAEAFNVFNTVNLGQPQASYSASAAQALTFGSISATGANPNRRLQFGFIAYF